MQARRIVLAATVALAAVLVASPPAGADYAEVWEYDVHAAGMPTTTDAARTLVSASVTHYYEGQVTDAAVAATVELGAEPDPASDATLHLVFGVTSPQGCEPQWDFSLSTYDPGTAGTRSGTTVSFRKPVPAEGTDQWTCSYVELVEPGAPGVVHDRLDGHLGTTIVIDPAPGVVMTVRDDGRVPVGRWSALRLRVFPRSDATRVVVDGRSRKPGVRVQRVVLGPEEVDDTMVYLPVRLGVPAPRRLVVTARAWNADGERIGLFRTRIRLEPRC